jgi:hypothetical protein
MGQDEKALIRLWQEKRGEIGPSGLFWLRSSREAVPQK